MITILVCGGRDFNDYQRVRRVLNTICYGESHIELVHGAQRGADLLAERWAKEMEIEYRGYPAKWKIFGKLAGPSRNVKMLQHNNIDLVVAFPGGDGTKDMIDLANKKGIKVIRG